MTDDEIISYLTKVFEAKAVPYWKLKHPPNYDEFKAGFANVGAEASGDMAEQQADRKKQLYWENRARELAATPNITKSEVLTAMAGVTLNAELTALLKEHLKRAK